MEHRLRQTLCSSGQFHHRQVVISLGALFLLLGREQCLPSTVVGQVVHQACLPSDPAMNCTHEIFRGQDVLWQIPPNPRGILFLAHGGDMDPFVFFDQGPGCPLCYGRPEDRTATLDGLREGYAVLALKSVEHIWWSSPEFVPGNDIDILSELLKIWTRRHELDHLPLVAWGHSSGGAFVSILPLFLDVQSLVIMCDGGVAEAMEQATAERYPPTFFAYMNNTVRPFPTVYDVQEAEATIAARGVPVFEKVLFSFPLSLTLFAERIHCIGSEVSRRIYEAFKADGSWLDERDYLVKNPFSDDWRAVLLGQNALPFCTEIGDVCFAEQVDQVLKVAQAVHSFTRDANSEIFAWLNSAVLKSTF